MSCTDLHVRITVSYSSGNWHDMTNSITEIPEDEVQLPQIALHQCAWRYVDYRCRKTLHTPPSHPTLGESERFCPGTLTNYAWRRVDYRCRKTLRTRSSHPTLGEHECFSQGTLTSSIGHKVKEMFRQAHHPTFCSHTRRVQPTIQGVYTMHCTPSRDDARPMGYRDFRVHAPRAKVV